MPLGKKVGLGLGNIVLDADPAPPPNGHSPPSFGICCGQTAGWIKMPFGTKAGLNQGHIVLHGDPAAPKRVTAPSPQFSVRVCCHSVVAKWSPISATADHLLPLILPNAD